MRIQQRIRAAWAAFTGAADTADSEELHKLRLGWAALCRIERDTRAVIARRNDSGRLPRVEKLIASIHAEACEGLHVPRLAMVAHTAKAKPDSAALAGGGAPL